MKAWTRRAAIGAAALAALGGVGLRIFPFRRRYPHTAYDDLIAHLTDREAGARLGAEIVGRQPGFDIVAAAARLRGELGRQNLVALLEADIAAGRMVEVGHWIIPETLALLCAVAAKA